MIGDNVQVSQGTPLGLGSFNLRATGDLYLYKEPGAAALRHRLARLDLRHRTRSRGGGSIVDPTSSINFRGDFNPEIFITVIARDFRRRDARDDRRHPNEPELRLASTPPLEPSDILSLIVFNTSTNRALGVAAAGAGGPRRNAGRWFVATPIVPALERSLGLETLEIEPPHRRTAGRRRVTIGNEIVPGLVARFSRQFGGSRVRRGHDRVLPLQDSAHPRDVLRRAIAGPAIAVPPRRARRHRPAGLLQLLDTLMDPRRSRLRHDDRGGRRRRHARARRRDATTSAPRAVSSASRTTRGIPCAPARAAAGAGPGGRRTSRARCIPRSSAIAPGACPICGMALEPRVVIARRSARTRSWST